MKELEFRDLDKIKYRRFDGFKEKMKQTPMYKDMGMDGGTIEHEGELYDVCLFLHNPSVCITHIDTHTIAHSDSDFIQENENPEVYKTCKYLSLKVLDDWIKETKRIHYGVKEEIKK